MRLSVIGLGKLGAPLAAVLADTGADVIGVDGDEALITRFQEGHFPALEPGLAALLQSGLGRLTFSTDAIAAVSQSEATFILVPTPSTDDGSYSHAQIADVLEQVGAGLRGKDGRHLVVIVSTLMPGTMQGVVAPSLEKASNRVLGPELGLCYCPEFVALGAVIEGMRHPDLVLIGQSDEAAGTQLVSILERTWARQPAVHRLDFINAELAKIAINGFVTTKISYANMLSELCERLPGGDARAVAAAMGSDSRIGPGYLMPGPGFAGPCFPRDNRAIAVLAERIGVSADLAVATDQVNRRQAARTVALVQSLLPTGAVGVLGLSYKPNSDVTEAAQGIEIAARLAELGYCVRVHDPVARADLPAGVAQIDDASECARLSDILVISTPWPDYAALTPEDVARTGRKLWIVDCWQMPELGRLRDHVTLVYPGTGIG